MSLGYAEKLSYKEDIGTVGMTEIFDSPQTLQEKTEELATIIKHSKHLVAFTGAGISTSCGIPDFRGPKGVWTLQRDGKSIPEASLPFDRATPSFTHMALVELEKAGILKFLISQNVDSLHLRSGIPRDKLSELHGNSFRELCPSCGVEYVRDFEVETIGMKETSRRCVDEICKARLKDTVLDWDDALPPKEMNLADKHCRMADVVLCLGTSLQVTPACNLPLRCIRGGGKVVIVNLQPTPKDKKAGLVIHGLVDKVIAGVMHLLNMRIPPYVRIDYLQICFKRLLSKDNDRYVKWAVSVVSVHGSRAPIPFLRSVEVLFPESPLLKSAILTKPPFQLRRHMLSRPLKMLVKLNFGDGCRCSCTIIDFPFNFEASMGSIDNDMDGVTQKLRDSALKDPRCGQYEIVERKSLLSTRSEITTYAIVTNVVRHRCNPVASPSKANGFVHQTYQNIVKRLNEGTNGNEASPKRLK
ncbi:hypothetical protein MKW94_029903 [Papaver nudicaule]|uniref:NAD-dependent protein deacetylase SRT1 n=1 Tax=Papaver nudicaule TaxID=74823 RepID=A0AA42B1E5_PAPNU|nr:hypothetical protein [Papaver nudicaule]